MTPMAQTPPEPRLPHAEPHLDEDRRVAWTDTTLLDLRWLHIVGPRLPVFRTLGALAREAIVEVQSTLPEREALRQWRSTSSGRESFEELRVATRDAYPDEYNEFLAMAEGAGVDAEELLCANLRGDIGSEDGTGCSDLLSTMGAGSIGAHNEDGAPNLRDQIMLVTLGIDEDPSVTAQWYPGFLPCNAHAVTGAGLGWGINHVQIVDPPAGAGRHFLARHVQRAVDVEDLLRGFRRADTAGGFSYNVVDFRSGTARNVEVAAGRCSVAEAAPGRTLWHTNHLLRLDSALDTDTGTRTGQSAASSALGLLDESRARGAYLADLAPEDEQLADPDWYFSQLVGHPLPHGVRRDAVGEDPLMTLVTTVCDTPRQLIHLRTRAGKGVSLPLGQYLRTAERSRLERLVGDPVRKEGKKS